MTSPDTDIEPAGEATEIVSVREGELATLGTAEDLRAKCEAFEAKRAVVVEYIKRSFIENTDFGPADPRNAKRTLLKPGAEKVCRLFNTRPTWRRDDETWEMLGKPAGTVCYVCEILDNTTGEIIGEGRGAETIGNKKRDANKTIKNAEKCALVDAALYTFCLSEMFTQDLGAGPDANPAPAADPNAEQAPSRGERSVADNLALSYWKRWEAAGGTEDTWKAALQKASDGKPVNCPSDLDPEQWGKVNVLVGELEEAGR